MPDNLYFLLLFFFFVVIPILERVFGKGRQQAPPPPQPRREAPPEEWQQEREPRGQPRALDRPPYRDESAGVGAHTDQDAPAADMVPDDLWEILTGEKRQRPAQGAPRPEPEWEPDPETGWGAWEVETEEAEAPVDVFDREIGGEGEQVERLRQAREDQVHTAERALPHARAIEVPAEITPAIRSRGGRAGALADEELRLRQARPRREAPRLAGYLPEFQRAFVLSEIFGKPKGLE
jgi:hypothetical protein